MRTWLSTIASPQARIEQGVGLLESQGLALSASTALAQSADDTAGGRSQPQAA